MLRQFLATTHLFDLPVLAMGIFLAFFAAVLVRACQRARAPEYRRMATLPLQDDATRRDPR
ncbi:MAG: hypothetical protein WAT39_08020 [Planctomycetota bacterium]